VFAFAPLLLLFILGAALSERSQVANQGDAPDVLIRTTTEEVVALIKQNGGSKADPDERQRLIGLIQEKVAPHFDFVAMTRSAVGVNWRSATPKEQERLTFEFRALLLRTYSQVLLSYQDNEIVYKPLRLSPGDTDAVVKIEIKQSGREAIHISFAMEKTSAGWKVRDVVVLGVSLVTNYRSSFTTKIRESGIDGLIRELEEKNKQLRK